MSVLGQVGDLGVERAVVDRRREAGLEAARAAAER
jgi:hypothetical protein